MVPRGARHWTKKGGPPAFVRAKLTPDQVRDIRSEIARGTLMDEIAERYGVTQGAISHIKHGRSWASVQ